MDVDGFTDDQLTSAEDVHFFPNMVGPIYPGIAILFRVRPNGTDPDSCIKDTWFLQWPSEDKPFERAGRRFFPDWTERDWGEITNQDYANMEHVQIGMKSRGGPPLRLNRRQESNLLHMHRMIDRTSPAVDRRRCTWPVSRHSDRNRSLFPRTQSVR